jgi:NAD(P)-dependent dehydrogenase (short-subunit alcohol dehydrogenase family)
LSFPPFAPPRICEFRLVLYNEAMKGRSVLITGGGSGFGRAVALQLAEAGARLALGDLNPATVEETAQLARERGAQAYAQKLDVTDADSVRAFTQAVVQRHGRIDGAFNSAGVLGPVGPMLDVPLAEFDRVMTVNVRGVWTCMQEQLRAMLAQPAPEGGYSIVNAASIAGLMGSPMLPAYSASKHAVVGMTRAAARYYGKQRIRVNCVCPGPVETPLAGPLFTTPGMRDAMMARQALPEFGKPEDVAAMVVWLLSPAAAMVTGTPLRVDAGALA